MKFFVCGVIFCTVEENMSWIFTFYTGELDFYVRSVGTCDLAPGEDGRRKEADFSEIFWCISGSGRFLDSEGKEHVLLPGSVWYYPPGSVHIYHAGNEGFYARWLTVAGPLAGPLFDGLKISYGINPAGNCPEEHFDRIFSLARNPSKMPEMLTEAMTVLLKMISPGNKTTERASLAEKAKHLIDNDFVNLNLNVEIIADKLACHRVSVARDFKQHYGIPISHYLHARRIQEAFHLIRDTAIPLREIPPLCGFSSISYLTKVIKKMTGSTPGELRKNALRNAPLPLEQNDLFPAKGAGTGQSVS